MADENPTIESMVEATPVVETASVASVPSTPTWDDSSFLSQLSERTGLELPDDVTSLDAFAERVDQLQQRASLLPEGIGAEQIQQWQAAQNFQNQVASQWDQFQAWHANQSQQPQYTQQSNIQPEVQQVAPAAPEWKPRWEFPEVSEEALRFIEQGEDGNYRPRSSVADSMQARQMAEVANRATLVTNDFVQNLTRKPYETASELFRPEMTKFEQRWEAEKLAPLRAQIEQLQSMLQPIQQMTQQQQLEAFEAPYDSYLYTDSTKSVYTPAGEAYATLAATGNMPLDQAIATVQRWFPPQAAAPEQAAIPVQQQVAAPVAPAAPKQSFIKKRIIGRATQMATGQPVEQTGSLNEPIPDSMMMSNEQLFDQARARAERAMSAMST